MSTTAISGETFMETIEGEGIVLVDFWADWCGPCKQFGPIFEAASERHSDITFSKVDTEAEQHLSRALEIASIPTLMAFRDGILLFSQAGALPAPALEQVIDSVRDADMDDVRAKVAEQEQSQASGG